MFRRSLSTALLLAALLAIAPAAYAKGPTGAAVDGPGIAAPVQIDSYQPVGDRPGLDDLMRVTGAQVLFGVRIPFSAHRPGGTLGPRYTIRYLFPNGQATPTTVLTQHLYPFAAGGPRTFTPPGQHSIFSAGTVSSGWYRAPTELTLMLAGLGAKNVQPEPAAAAEPRSDAGESGRWGGLAVPILAGAALLAAAVPLVRRLVPTPVRR